MAHSFTLKKIDLISEPALIQGGSLKRELFKGDRVPGDWSMPLTATSIPPLMAT
jgi:hypothetical protein